MGKTSLFYYKKEMYTEQYTRIERYTDTKSSETEESLDEARVHRCTCTNKHYVNRPFKETRPPERLYFKRI